MNLPNNSLKFINLKEKFKVENQEIKKENQEFNRGKYENRRNSEFSISNFC